MLKRGEDMAIVKKFLDYDGLSYFSKYLRNYPTTNFLNAVIESMQDELNTKQNTILFASRAEWRANRTFVPEKGQIIVYTDKGTITKEGSIVDIPGIKVGDGVTYGVDLPFLGDELAEEISKLLSHVSDTGIHVTLEEKNFWNNKLNCTYNNENLIFNKE